MMAAGVLVEKPRRWSRSHAAGSYSGQLLEWLRWLPGRQRAKKAEAAVEREPRASETAEPQASVAKVAESLRCGLRAPGGKLCVGWPRGGLQPMGGGAWPSQGGGGGPRRPPECVRGTQGACATYVLSAELGPSLTDKADPTPVTPLPSRNVSKDPLK